MGRNYSTAIAIAFVTYFFSSCAFDPPNSNLIGLGKDYYVSTGNPNDDTKIMYSFKQNLYQVVASNCVSVYCDSNIIVFSKNLFEGDTINFEYFLIEKKPETELRKISKATFEKEKSGLNKVEIANQ